jgi:hypothetical protein
MIENVERLQHKYEQRYHPGMATSFWVLILSKNGNTKVFCFQSKSRLNDKINFGHCSGRRKHERDPYIIMSEM